MARKCKGFDFYEQTLKSPKTVVAPMVEASELAWRMLARKYGADLCFTPMWHAGVFVRNERYRLDALQTCPEDRPLIVQFCANDPATLRRAVELTQELIDCDAVDLNLGCPQVIARRGHFGAFLQDEWELISSLVKAVDENCRLPITCKLRVFPDVKRTVEYARMLEAAGAQLLTVHGRTREQKGGLTGLASWAHIRAVKEAVNVPVVANGNIQSLEDVHRCLEETGVQAVMSAEGHLTNPALFAGINPPIWQMAEEYLDMVDCYPCPLSYTRGHLFKLLHHCLQLKMNFDVRDVIAKGSSLEQFRGGLLVLKDRMMPYHAGEKVWTEPEEQKKYKLKYPPWICQPYVRPPPEEHQKKLEENRQKEKLKLSNQENKRSVSDKHAGEELSRKKQKKLDKNPHKQFPNGRKNCKLCLECPNPCGTKCERELCKKCCKHKCFREELDCEGHKIKVKSKREAARRHREQREKEQLTSA